MPQDSHTSEVVDLLRRLLLRSADAPPEQAAARERLTRERAEAHARAADASSASADLYERIAEARRAEIDAARARASARPTALTGEETGAALLAAARARIEAAARWRLAAERLPDLLPRAAEAQAQAFRLASISGPWFRSAATAHLAAGDLLQGSRALEGAAKADALAADALALPA